MASRSSTAIPERLGRYEIIQRLAAGGMGEVFLARFAGPGGFLKPVALKRVHPHLADDPSFIDMLHDEANVASSIQHPNIVATIDVGAEGSNHYVVVDYVSGDPLSRVVRELKSREEHMPRWVVAWVGAQIASALCAAHEAKSLSGEPLEIVHRDVSSANIMLSDAGHAMLFDFGIAKARQRHAQNTMTGAIKGKLTYMAPETFRGVRPTKTVDIFALGVVLYELLTNVSPYQRDNELETLMALQNDDVPPPSEVRGGIDADLDAIVMRAMARDREDRYATADALERALRDWASRTSSPHDATSVADWFASEFPDRLAARKQLLARIGEPIRPTPIDEPPSSREIETRPSQPSGKVESNVGSISVDGLMTRTPPPLTRSERPPREGRRGWLAAATGLAIGTLTAVFVFTRHDGPRVTGGESAAHGPSTESSTSATHVATDAPTSTATATATAAVATPPVVLAAPPAAVDFDSLPDAPVKAAPRGPKDAKPAAARPPAGNEGSPPSRAPGPTATPSEPTKKGPLVRSYEP